MGTAKAPDPTDREIREDTWEEVHASAEFVELRRRLRRFVFPMTVLFLVWYLVYVLLADYAHGFMATRLVGNLNVGLLLGLLQFVSTFVITSRYVRYADRKLDPLATRIRETVEGGDR
ncbi:DUF485 domain-containing protein [Actinokineospora auranticolor]|uniref:Uncharacterized membrane protein (DUF485 family) n=1 Tax=Actinokineospora auranticolor TaxID=155976 RepID=A0A2S6GM41_9PSEU|nr:DUF485 domain-containing protein [Actinokineospora auranticolor]PPK66304.1 uncharacterized membrane protein (DUF485 family) [Actinokineospora auranticolor]